jgi:hypothetical protein
MDAPDHVRVDRIDEKANEVPELVWKRISDGVGNI